MREWESTGVIRGSWKEREREGGGEWEKVVAAQASALMKRLKYSGLQQSDKLAKGVLSCTSNFLEKLSK